MKPFVNLEEEFIAEKNGLPLHLNRELSRNDYEDLIDALVSKTLVCVDEALTDAKLQANQIDKVVLVGGASRTPLVHRLLEERLNLPIHTEVDPDLCVAMGAAVQGALISGANVDSVLVDITPHTLGIQTLGYLHGFRSNLVFSPIIERNTVLPASRSEVYSTVYDGQDAVIIAAYQGENESTEYNDLVGEFRLEGLADVAQGNEILVRFDLDLNGILKVTAVERATGLEKRLVIDNAMYRFRSTNRDAALARLDAAFQVGQPTEVKEPAEAPSEELQQALSEADDLLGKGRKLLESVPTEDADELQSKIEMLQAAVDERSLDGMNQTYSELEDLVFYLQDA